MYDLSGFANKVFGNFQVTGGFALGSYASLTEPGFGFVFNFSEDIEDFSLATYWAVFGMYINIEPDAALDPSTFIGIRDWETYTPDDNTEDIPFLNTDYFYFSHLGSGNIAYLDGFDCKITIAGAGSADDVRGATFGTGHYGTGGSIGTDITVTILSPGHARPMTTHKGLMIENQEYGTNSWAIFSDGGKNFFKGNVGIGAGSSVPDHTLDVRGEISIFGASASNGRLRLRGFYTSSPANPPADQTDMMVVDNGVTPVFRVRYNDSGVMKVGDLVLV